MKYMLLIHADEKAWHALAEAERQQVYGEYRKLGDQLRVNGQFVDGSELQPSSMSTTVRVRDGRRLVTDGPFAETREQLGGFFVIDVKNLDEAIGIAARIPGAATGTVEIRPLVGERVPARA